MRTLIIVAVLFLTGIAVAQTGPAMEIEGTIAKVEATRGRGMPFIEVDTGSEVKKVQLGSIRYLVEQNFNPKVGDAVEVVGFSNSAGSDLVAKSVTLTKEGKRIELRRDDGTPLWQRGRYGRTGRGRGGNSQ